MKRCGSRSKSTKFEYHRPIIKIAAWLEQRIDNAEHSQEHLAELTQRVRDASKVVYIVTGDGLVTAMQAQDHAIRDLVDYVATST